MEKVEFYGIFQENPLFISETLVYNLLQKTFRITNRNYFPKETDRLLRVRKDGREF